MSKPLVAIIGAGASGLTCIKQCLADNLEPVCLEASSNTAGLWRFTEVDEENKDPHSSIYKSVIINTSKEMSTFSDFPIPPDWPYFMHNKLVAKYFDMYAERFQLIPYIKFNTTVLNASILPDQRWKVRYVTKGEDETERVFDYVMVCTGHHRYPRLPNYKGMDKFKGIQIHSHFYREPTNFRDKRVVIVGCGNSGMDISVELSENASQSYICTRRGTLPWIVPRLVNGKPIDHKFSRFYITWLPQFIKDHIIKIISKATIGLPPPGLEPKDKPSNSHPTMKTNFYERLSTGTLIVKPDISQLNEDGSIEFVDGTKVEKIDAVIYATGYQIEYPFLDRDIVCDQEVLKEFDEEYRENLVWLYKRMFPPKYPNIAFIGLVQLIGAIFPLSEMQARYVTSLIKGYIPQHPSIPEMHKEIRKHQKLFQKRYYNAARHTIQGDYFIEIDSLAKDLGYYPYPCQIIKKYGFSLYLKVLFGIPNAFQYRLLGRQSWNGAADAIRVYNGCDPSKIKQS
ncbi:flavin monooxygenase-like protein [Gigaspora rosea]|uniref:Flavin-containing monooxygenase 1 n=1 Tax=Gigaspora rosea TaxID=44941 RepID=A0A397UMX2_9GLOM|nr:flavin monooxygenase-like protein [Gigaspora rosea]